MRIIACVLSVVLVLVLHRGAVTVSSAGPRKLFKGVFNWKTKETNSL
jgi:hypothetical protein